MEEPRKPGTYVLRGKHPTGPWPDGEHAGGCGLVVVVHGPRTLHRPYGTARVRLATGPQSRCSFLRMVAPPPTRRAPRWAQGTAAVARAATWFKRVVGSGLEHDELVGVGNEALVLAERDFAPARGVPFEAYARLRIRRAMASATRTESRLGGRTRAILRATELADDAFEELAADDDYRDRPQLWVNSSAAAATLALMHAVDYGGDPGEHVERAELKRRAAGHLATRPQPVPRLFGLVYEEGRTLDEAGRTCGKSAAWASRLHAREIALLAEALRAYERPRATAGRE